MKKVLTILTAVAAITSVSCAFAALSESERDPSMAVKKASAPASDPSAALRKLAPPAPPTGANSALAQLEKVNRLNNDMAIKYFTDILQKNPKDASAYSKRGKAYSGNKEYDKAIGDYGMVIQLDPKAAEAYTGRAVAYFFKNDYDKSWEDVHKAEELGGQFWPSFKEALKSSSKRDK